MELPKSYNPKDHEDRIYKMWEDSGYFNPDKLPEAEKREPYTIIMPPPNANGQMHLGHALFVTIEDILVRFNRMNGKRTLWLPGTDHAGFETQVVYEKKLEKEGRSRFKMEREEFYNEVYDYVQTYKQATEDGLRRLGASCDWSRNTFTLDEQIIKIVYETFEQMYKDGLVYRGERISNWCIKHQTSLSDLETKYEERTEPLYYLKYGPFTIATARPETKFGDKYVVMHPDDKRYAKYKHGDMIELDWINGPITATIIKDESIDIEFGTGVMTITPWHDTADFEIAQRHSLEKEQIIDTYGKLLPIAGEFAGMKIKKARPLIVDKLKSKNLLEKIEEDYKHNVHLCYKCGNIIEPQIIPQWFVAMTKPLPDGRPSLRDMAVKAVKSGEIKIIPERFEKVYMHWLENIRDWAISRQIAWGIPIPVWYRGDEIHIGAETPAGDGWIKDADTFDTWFSSGQWPYAALMARGEKDFQTYYPTQVMETGWDILFFWVARMVMFGYYKTGEKPFSNVFLHGIVRDKDRQKMSKSKGNVVDPLGIIDTYGTDALRFALVFSTSAGTDIPLAEDKVKGMKHFGNKVWNIARFVMTNLAESRSTNYELRPEAKTDADKDILQKLETIVREVTENLENFRLHEAAQAIYQFTWHEFADIYIEASKEQLNDPNLKENTLNTLFYVLSSVLKLLHPFMPFVTEAIWQQMKSKNLLMIETWPE